MLINILWFAAYIVTGFVAFWLLSKEDCHFAKRLRKESDSTCNDAGMKYLCLTKWQPRNYTDPRVLTVGCLLAIVFVALWPVVTICCAVYYPIAYHIAVKEGP